MRPRQLPYEDYWAIETMRDFDPEDPRDWVTRIVQQCRDLSIEVEIH